MTTLSNAKLYESVASHNHTLANTLRTLVLAKVLRESDLKTIVDELHTDNLFRLGSDFLKDAEARKRVTNALAREAKVVPVLSRGKEGRPCGECYTNAYKEFKETGNPIAYGWINGSTIVQDYFASYIPHAFNYDKETGQYYDTTNFITPARRTTTIAFLITDRIQALATQDVTASTPARTLDATLGGWVFLSYKGKTYVLRGWHHPAPGEELVPHYKVMKYVTVL